MRVHLRMSILYTQEQLCLTVEGVYSVYLEAPVSITLFVSFHSPNRTICDHVGSIQTVSLFILGTGKIEKLVIQWLHKREPLIHMQKIHVQSVNGY